MRGFFMPGYRKVKISCTMAFPLNYVKTDSYDGYAVH